MDRAQCQPLGNTAVDRKARSLLLRILLPVGMADNKLANK